MPLSLIPLLLTLFLPFYASAAIHFFLVRYLDAKNDKKRAEILSGLGVDDELQDTKKVVGLFHPYWWVISVLGIG
jgi:hypothetical protein